MAWWDIFTGHNAGLDNAANSVKNLAGYSTGVGEKGTNADMQYNLGILSGDPSQVAKTLAPETAQLQDQAQQNKNTVGQFGNRGGGMNAVMASLDDATRAKLLGLAGGLRTGAAHELGTLGTNNLNMASNDTAEQARIAQEQHENMMNSIFGKAISGGLGFLQGKALPGVAKFLFGGGSPTPQATPDSGYVPPVSGDWRTQL